MTNHDLRALLDEAVTALEPLAKLADEISSFPQLTGLETGTFWVFGEGGRLTIEIPLHRFNAAHATLARIKEKTGG